MPFLYGIGIAWFGASIDSDGLMTIGILVFFSGFVTPFISLFSDELKSTAVTSLKTIFSLIPEKQDKAPPPAQLVDDVEKLRTATLPEGKYKGELARLRPLIVDYPSLKRKLEQYKTEANIQYRVKEHEHTLLKNLDRALVKDDYGTVLKDSRDDEIIRFLDSMNAVPEGMDTNKATSLVKDTLSELKTAQKARGFDPSTAPENGLDFEYWVAGQLNLYGWTAEVTQGSGDQGADVIARRGKITVGIQCKRYSSNVGNKAIQEAISATQHYRFDRAAVVATSGYTKSAKELAVSTGVALLTHYDIPKLAKLTGAS